jgi:hypothetical protein
MDRSLGLSSALAMQAMTAVNAPAMRPSSPPPGDHRDRLAQRMNDVVVRRIFAAGLDLQAALGLIGEHRAAADHRAAGRICHATDELDHAIRDLRNILFERGPQ